MCEACQIRSQFVQSPTSNAQPYHSKPRMSLYPSLNLSPGGPRTPPTRRQKAENFGFFAFLTEFFAFRNACQNLHRKNVEKRAKIEDFGLPKPTPNPPKMASFLKTSIFEKSCSRRGEIAIFEVSGLPKRRPNPSKIDVKNVSFFNIDFFGFRPRFWRVVGLQFGAKLAILASQNFVGAPFLPS